MNNLILEKLANIATIRKHIDYVVNGVRDKKVINPIQKISKELDDEFVKLLMESITLEEPKVVAATVPVSDSVLSTSDISNLSEEDEERPKIKSSKKTAKKNAGK